MGRQSTIDRLPQEAREALNTWLRDPAITQEEATARVNALLEELGLAEHKVSRHAVNRYDLKMREVGRRLRESRQVAEAWIAKLGAAPQGQLGHLVNEILRTLAFDLSLQLQDGVASLDAESAPALVRMLKELSISVHRLEQAAGENVRREREIRAQALAEAAERAGEEARRGGLSDETIEAIRNRIMGIS